MPVRTLPLFLPLEKDPGSETTMRKFLHGYLNRSGICFAEPGIGPSVWSIVEDSWAAELHFQSLPFLGFPLFRLQQCLTKFF